MIERLAKKFFSADVLGILLILLSLQILAYGISSSLLGAETGPLFLICTIAATAGWILCRHKWRGYFASLVIIVLGAIGIWIVAARLVTPLFDLIQSLAGLAPQIIPVLQAKITLDTSQVREAWTAVVQFSSILASRWQLWVISFDQNINVDDILIRNMIWSFVMWCFGAWTGWFAAKRNALLALLPDIGLLAIIVSYSEYRTYSLWLLVLFMLLLMGLWNYKNHTAQWEQRRVDYSDSIVYDNTQAVILLAILVGTLSFSVPSISWRDFQYAIREGNKNEAAEMLGIREQTIPVGKPIVQKPSLPQQHLLTDEPAQSEDVVMTIRTGELPRLPDSSFARNLPRHYWRSTVYDRYMGTGWVTSLSLPQTYRANVSLIPGLLDDYRLLHLDVKLQEREGKLFWSGILYSATVPFRAAWRVLPQPSLFADQTGLLEADLYAATTEATAYQVDSYIPSIGISDLRSASTEYPEELQTRYLQLTPDLPERVKQLAKEITFGIENPYDKAKAIEAYLRAKYPYDLEIPSPPQDRDVTDYFLFDLKRGYCDYYATAMVVLARANGLPARFVTGYSPGSYDAPNAQYIVRKLNAHSWAEVYFPEIGWIEFEPTASEPEIQRNESASEFPVEETIASPTEKFLFKLTNTGLLYWISPFVAALFLVLLYYLLLERYWVLSRGPTSAIAYLYHRYYRLGRPLAGERTRAETASEFTSRLTQKIDEFRSPSKQAKLFKADAQLLTNTYLLSLFSNHTIEREDASNAFDLWRRLRRHMFLARLKLFTSMRRKKSS